LVFGKNIENDFKQDIGALFESLSRLEGFSGSAAIALVVLTMLCLQRLLVPGQNSEGYVINNRSLLVNCSEWSALHPRLLLLPFLSADLSEDKASIENLMDFDISPWSVLTQNSMSTRDSKRNVEKMRRRPG